MKAVKAVLVERGHPERHGAVLAALCRQRIRISAARSSSGPA
jgi:hypothetical protein